MNFLPKITAMSLCLMLGACGTSASPEDMKMADSLSTQGRALLALGKAEEARDTYMAAVHRDQANPRAWNGLGVSYDLLGKSKDAEEAYRQALDIAPKDPIAANNLAHLYLAKGDAEAAVELLEPFADVKTAPAVLKQNLQEARRRVAEPPAKPAEPYADLGSFPTEGMAKGRIAEAQKALDSDLDFLIVPEVKKEGGTPVFTVRISGTKPASICKALAKAGPCVPHEAK